MLCDKCHTNPATVHVERIVNNVKMEKNLCLSCAAQEGAEMSFDKIMKEFLGSFLENIGDNIFELANSNVQVKTERETAVCPTCGVNFEEFREEGKLGCANCYKVFRREIDAILKNVHGSSEHMGKTPQKAPRVMLIRREIDALRRGLNTAIENEEYETAAELRDKIRAAEKTALTNDEKKAREDGE